MNSDVNREKKKDKISKEQPKQSDRTNFGLGLEELGKQFQVLFKKSSNDISSLIKVELQKLPIGPESFSIISYEEAISYFVVSRPLDPKIAKGAMLKYPHLEGHLFFQVFLDSENHLVCQPDDTPYGRQVIVEKFDDELTETFGNRDLIIVE